MDIPTWNMPNEEFPRPLIRQASAIPFRRGVDGLELCLITTVNKGRWGFPKGVIDPGETRVQTALKETREEAGLRGRILPRPVGTYRYAKWGVTLHVTVLLMEVTHCDEDWEEREVRQRRWAEPQQAIELVKQKVLNRLLRAALKRLTKNGTLTPDRGGDIA